MKILWGSKDGGPESRVWVWGFESKRFGSILLAKFAKGSREAFHTHAFNALSWLLKGNLMECIHGRCALEAHFYEPSIRPIFTPRERFHRVLGIDDANWVLTFRGPWVARWREYRPLERRYVGLTHGRKETN